MVTQPKRNFFQRMFRLGEEATSVRDPAQVAVLHTLEIGSPGTESYSGYPAEEYLQSLKGTTRADEFDKMRRSDPQVQMIMSAVKNPIKGAVYEVEPAGEDEMQDREAAKADAELIEQILMKDISWKQFIIEALTACDFGHAVFERTHCAVLNHPKFGSYNGLKKLGWRSPRTIERFNIDSFGDLVSITQYAYGDVDRMVDIPAKDLVVITLNREGANYEGISLLRPCYGNWMRKNLFLKMNAIGIEKFAVPTAIGTFPQGTDLLGQDYANFKNVLRSYTSHQTNFITHPDGWKVELKSNAYDPSKVDVAIDSEDKRMVKALLANFLELGMNGTGSYALSNDISDFFLAGLTQIVDVILDPINRQLIPELIKLNRGVRPAYPTVKASRISDKAGKELAEILTMLKTSGFISPAAADEEHIRKAYNLPKAKDAADPSLATPGAAPEPGAQPAAAPSVQETVFNGAQVASMLELVTAVAMKQIPRESAREMLVAAFRMSPADADKLLGPVGETFEPAPPPAPPAGPAVEPTLAEKIRQARTFRMKREGGSV